MTEKIGSSDPALLGDLTKRIADLENRITRLEKAVSFADTEAGATLRDKQTDTIGSGTGRPQNLSIESHIGEYGMAWMGNFVLLFGFLFLTQYLQNSDHLILSLIIGFFSIGIVFLAGYFTRTSLPYMSMLFNYNGYILLYIQVMRVCLFRESMIITNTVVSHTLVLLVLLSFLYLAYRKNSQVLAVLTWIMMGVTAVTNGQTHFMLSLMLAITGSAILFAIRRDWWTSLIISVFFVYFIFLNWILGNPLAGGAFEFRTDHQMGYFYLYVCAVAYSLLALLHVSERVTVNRLQPVIVLNGISFSIIIGLAAPAFFSENYFVHFGIIASFCILYSVWLKVRGDWNIIAAMYALYSFVSLSITIAGIYHFPLAFFLLAIQSLLVVSLALWFRSRFMVVMNTILFTGLLLVYVLTTEPLNTTNFSFALVALITARIINWKKERLEIRTELIRNLFLLSGAAMVLFSLHEAVPANFVTLSWTGAALVFFLLSVLIKNMKYRWLAITTMVITVFYLFIVDLSNISLGYRIIALMFIAVISLGISIFYSRRLKQKKQEEVQ